MAKTGIISKRLKGLMAENDMTNAELAKKLGISPRALTRRINGDTGWMFNEISLVTKLFGFSEVRIVFPELYNAVEERII